MENTEIIKALRWCGSEDERHEMCVDESYRCPMWNEDRITDECKADLMLAAADALEAAEQRIAELEAQNELKDGTITAMATDIGKLQAQMQTVTECHAFEEGER